MQIVWKYFFVFVDFLFLFWCVVKFPKYLWELEVHLGKKGGNKPIYER